MDWNDLKNNPRLKMAYDLRVEILRLTREFFWANDFKETDTPVALKYPGQEPYLNPIPVLFHNPQNTEEKFYLRTSPEFALKKLLASGYPKIFEIGKCFRDFEQWGGNHNTEFTMLEFYRAPGTQFEIMSDIESLFKFLTKNLNSAIFNFQFSIFNGGWERITMKDLWKRELNIDLDSNLTLSEIIKTAEDMGFSVDKTDAYEDVFYKIFLNKIETKLGKERPVFVYDYPAQMCSLSKKCESDERYAQRFELYIDGLELANGFGELTDSKNQKELLQKDQDKRKELKKEIWNIDEDFISALDEIKTEASGVALGLDRVIKLFAGIQDLNETIFQSVADQIK